MKSSGGKRVRSRLSCSPLSASGRLDNMSGAACCLPGRV